MSLEARFAEAMGALTGPDLPSDIGLAVSGGGDSMAMLYLAHDWSRVRGVRLHVVTVDHGLRAEAAAEAAMVADACAALGWPHDVLRWDWDGTGNLMDAARRGRLAVIGGWARGRRVLFAHTRDDLAETFLLRLARGSGVEGLSAMAARREAGVRVLRPCLGMTRAELRHYLTVLKGRWVEDPSNDDARFDRVKMRQALPALAVLGFDVETLAATAERMARAREALRARAAQVWGEIGQEGCVGAAPTGELLFDRAGFEAVERDTQLRLLAAALQWVASAGYRPRVEPLEALLDRLLGGGGGTLHGCEARMERDALRVFREFRVVAGLRLPLGDGCPGLWDGLWDGRWQVCAVPTEGAHVRALGEDGWAQIPGKPRAGPPFHSARSLPSLWRGDALLACDALGFGSGLSTRLRRMGREPHDFTRFLLSH